jgi:hypothetical protein
VIRWDNWFANVLENFLHDGRQRPQRVGRKSEMVKVFMAKKKTPVRVDPKRPKRKRKRGKGKSIK